MSDRIVSRESMAGFCSSLTSVFLTYPINKLMYRQHISNGHLVNALKSVRADGLGQLMRGAAFPIIYKSISRSVMFGSYHFYDQKCILEFGKDSWLRKPTASAMAGCSEAILTPFERMMVLMQDPKLTAQFKHSFDATLHVTRNHGVLELYRGFSVICVRIDRSCFSMVFKERNFLFFASRIPFRDALNLRNEALANFIGGGVVGATISTALFPIYLVKCEMQRVYGKREPFLSCRQAVKRVNLKRGSRQLFKGSSVNFLRAMVGWGTVNATYELFLKYI
ncbi:hypothetical protein ACOME3_007613 [Neoechinorhynchus agilis]